MKKWVATAMFLVVVSGWTVLANDWYDPADWFDEDESQLQNDWWTNGAVAQEGLYNGQQEDYNIYGYVSGMTGNLDDGWGYGYDYNTLDWYEYDDSFSKWYEDDNDPWF